MLIPVPARLRTLRCGGASLIFESRNPQCAANVIELASHAGLHDWAEAEAQWRMLWGAPADLLQLRWEYMSHPSFLPSEILARRTCLLVRRELVLEHRGFVPPRLNDEANEFVVRHLEFPVEAGWLERLPLPLHEYMFDETQDSLFIVESTRNNSVAGFLTLTPTETGYLVENVYVEPAMRRRGIATQLVRHATEHVRARGEHLQIALTVDTDNRAQLLYANLGYVPLRTVETAIFSAAI